MTRNLLPCFLLFSLSASLFAQCVKTVPLTSGDLMLTGSAPYNSVNVTGYLKAHAYIITNIFGDENNWGIGSLCNEGSDGCTPSQISSYIQNSIIEFPADGGMSVNVQAFGMWGYPGFLATSFHSSVDADGNLMVSGDAVGYGMFNECSLSGFCSSIPDEICFDFGTTSWQYSGEFIQDIQRGSEANRGAYDFSYLEIKIKTSR